MILALCVSAVLSAIPSCASLFVFSSARRRMISISRGVVPGGGPLSLLMPARCLEKSPQDDFGYFQRRENADARRGKWADLARFPQLPQGCGKLGKICVEGLDIF
jgi:hypothetical protein